MTTKDYRLPEEKIALILDTSPEERTYKSVGVHVTTIDVYPLLDAQIASDKVRIKADLLSKVSTPEGLKEELELILLSTDNDNPIPAILNLFQRYARKEGQQEILDKVKYQIDEFSDDEVLGFAIRGAYPNWQALQKEEL